MEKEKPKTKEKEKTRVAVVRVRGKVHVRSDIEDTLMMLNLNKPNHCVVVDSSGEYLGMIKKVNDYVTWGEIKPETMEELIRLRGKLPGNKEVTDEHMKKNTPHKSIKDFVEAFMSHKTQIRDVGLKPVFRLKPPSMGHERGGIKKPYTLGGVLGYRGDKINDLIKNMIR